ncbi:hypothetical protein [Streptomyces griseocarneus]|uniref:hypothetical protein n=1 Tax=Streptomyces griseocarneus TaxID=51201 RepID=UPI00167D701A|nr:hypothetical protein [Streptomyces griseocarneus]MBZ6478033.1 hypothetical protein [Streptomyces griseocarneus]GHG64147.1 hypothetical protein GCM10018779_33870 [Streptomyces griseocarneus]
MNDKIALALGTCPPGACNKINTIGSWITFLAAWAAGVAFVISGAILCWAYFSGHGSSRAMKALGGACGGSIVISAASALANALLA